ncbi:MAG: methionine synthase [Chloroflexi bacterium]|nr:methionine synthase [Chloroflexota bacterium]
MAATPTLRVDVIGSFLRPAGLVEAYRRHGAGEITEAAMRQAQDESIRDVIAKQEAHGMPVVTDGEFRRLNFQDSFGASVEGFAATRATYQYYAGRAVQEERSLETGRPLRRWESGLNEEGPAIVARRPAKERLRLVRNQPLEEYRFSRQVAARPVKVTLVSPDRISQRFAWEESTPVYPDLDAFVDDVVAIERRMVTELVEAGCSYVQIDGPGYTAYVDPPSLERMRARGEDPAANLARSIRADNAIIAGVPGTTFGIHLCRGNTPAGWHREGSYDAIAEQVFAGLAHERLLLEYDTERAGGFEPLRFVPRGKIVVLGLVSTKVARIETVDELKRRIEEAIRFIPIGQLALSPQCGFGSSLAQRPLTEDDQWRKLEVMQETARQVWG